MNQASHILSQFKPGDIAPPHGAGVYIIYGLPMDYFFQRNFSKSRLLYIGSSKQIQKRILSPNHPYTKMINKWDDIFVYCMYYETGDFINIESILIRELSPYLNKRGKKIH